MQRLGYTQRMHASSICPACNQTGNFGEVCPNCGQRTGLSRDTLTSALVASIEARVEKEWHRAAQNYPQLSLPLQQFLAKVLQIAEKQISVNVADNLTREQAIAVLLENLKWPDLYLTTACASGDAGAWEQFRRQYQSVIRSAALKASTSSSEAAELSDTLLTDFFLPQGSARGESKIGQYHGLGSLEGWIKVVVHRMAIDQIRLHQRDVSIEELEVQLPAKSSHGRADAIIEERDIRRAREMVSECLKAALEQLSTEEKLVLSLYYLEGVNLKGIGQFLKAHESTASRLLDRLKIKLQKSVNKQLQQRFKVRKAEIRQVIELAQEHIEINLANILSS